VFLAPTRVWWAALVIVVALLELCFTPVTLLTRIAVGMLALIAAILGGIVLWSAREEPEPAPILEPAPEPKPAPEPPPPLNEQVSPRFGRGSKAQALPWLLSPHAVYPGIAADEGRLGQLTVRAASVIGPGHRCEEPVSPRQDAYRLGRDDAGTHLVVAVADGVSSSAFAELGATVAASAAVNLLRERLNRADTLAWPEIFGGIAAQMAEAAATRGLRDADICTALVTALIPTGWDRTMWVAWVGDASVWLLQGNEWIFVAGDRKRSSGGVESNVVAHVLPTSPHAVATTAVRIAPGSVIAIVTDGIGDALATLPEANRYFARSWATPPSSTAFIDDVGYDAEGFQDDRTAVAVWVSP
jgi:serine/threonine protein phosphatase PrpC